MRKSTIKVEITESKVYYWKWFYPMEKNTEVLLLCGNGPNRIRNVLNSFFDSDAPPLKNEGGRFIHYNTEPHVHAYVIIIPEDWTNSPEQISYLSHELNHMIFCHFKIKGYHIPIVGEDGNDEEHFNGQQEYWLRAMLECLIKPEEKFVFKFKNEKRIN